MGTFRIGLLVAVLALGAVRPAESCTCIGSQSVRHEKKWAEAVFVAEVVDISSLCSNSNRCGCDEAQVRLRVVASWKGIQQDEGEVTVFSAAGEACGYPFELHKRYLIYAAHEPPPNWGSGFGRVVGDREQLIVSVCGRTAPIEEAKSDLRKLGKPLFTVESSD